LSNGTAEELLFSQFLEAGGRRYAWLSSLDLQLVATLEAHFEATSNL
jgi:hypothetical protein